MIYVLVYLSAIIAANLLVAWLGPRIVIFNALVLIGLDLVARDKLHDAWNGRHLAAKITALIATGSLITWLLNPGAGRVALASVLAFGLAAIADTLVYHLLRHRQPLARINGSNVLAALVDSIVFPTIAFGAWLPVIIAGQFAAKVGGGFLWSLILRRTWAPSLYREATP